LSNTCPQAGAVRRVVATRGQVSNKPKRTTTLPQPDLAEPHPRQVALSFQPPEPHQARNSVSVEDVGNPFGLARPIIHHHSSDDARDLAPLDV
jgi:hypothetical protein